MWSSRAFRPVLNAQRQYQPLLRNQERQILFSSQHKPVRVSNSLINGLINGGILVIAGTGFVAWMYGRQKKQKALKGCNELPRDPGIKADLPLVEYRGCVLPRGIFTDGTMERLSTFEFRDDDVLVASYPKSGTTWLQEVVYRLSHLRGQKDQYCGDVLETKFPYLEFSYPGLNDISRRKGRRFLKTHLPHHLLPDSLANSKAKVLYISRNPKDVCASYYHFAAALTYIDFRGTFSEFIQRLFLADSAPYSPYFPHLHGYDKKATAEPGRCLHVRYEDMKEDSRREIRRIAKFLGIEGITDEEVESVASNTSFAAMRANPLTNFSHWDGWGVKNPGHQGEFFYRKGIVGDFDNHSLDEATRMAFDSWIKSGVSKTGLHFKYSGS